MLVLCFDQLTNFKSNAETISWLICRLTENASDKPFEWSYNQKMPNISWFQLLKCEDRLFFEYEFTEYFWGLDCWWDKNIDLNVIWQLLSELTFFTSNDGRVSVDSIRNHSLLIEGELCIWAKKERKKLNRTFTHKGTKRMSKMCYVHSCNITNLNGFTRPICGWFLSVIPI